jgi:O-succinylbenzoate synthase
MPGFVRVYDPRGMRDQLHDVELVRIRIPFVREFASAHGSVRQKDALLVRVHSESGVGWGECAAQATPSYAPETIDTARMALRDHLLPRVFAGASCADVRGHPMARAALECALLDARLRGERRSLADYVGASRRSIPAGVAIGLPDDLGQFRDLVAFYVAQGYRRVKCKIMPGHDVAVLQAAREVAGDGVELAADANGSYTITDIDHLCELDAFALQCIEQPLARDALADHAALARSIATPIGLDESISSAARARDAFASGACRVVSVKPGRLGGIAESKRVLDASTAAGGFALAGGMLETGVGRAALVALAALPEFTMTGDCSASDRYFADDLTEPFVLDAGSLRVPEGPGLGVDVRPEQLARYTIARERITPADS